MLLYGNATMVVQGVNKEEAVFPEEKRCIFVLLVRERKLLPQDVEFSRQKKQKNFDALNLIGSDLLLPSVPKFMVEVSSPRVSHRTPLLHPPADEFFPHPQ